MSDLQAKQLKPAGQKNTIVFDGESAVTTEVTVLNTGDIYLAYQKYEKDKEPKWNGEFNNYKSISMFIFDASGNIKKTYGLDINPDQKGTKAGYNNVFGKPAQNYFYTSGDNKSLYWFIRSPKDGACTQTQCDENFCDFHCWPLLGVDYCSINIETGELSELKTFGNDKKNPFYVFNITNPLHLDNFVYFFSEDEDKKGNGGDNMHLTRIDISK
ncbi:MAG TPA: hypothetical protein VFL70_04365 [Bacteroidia bacterium]|nr:hypothetical protein [Bacteroidia bacterium]